MKGWYVMGKGILKISADLLMQLLLLDGYKVIDARFNGFSYVGGVIEVAVEHDSIGEDLPSVLPIYKKIDAVLDNVQCE